MALNIVRNDITKIKADAIVNSTNEHFVVGGFGVDASIHYAAGPKLREALDEIGSCPVGSSVVTDSFNIPTCRYIIHAVAPIHQRGDFKEKILLRKTYHSILRVATEKKCKSVAIPLLSAGANGYPGKEAYEIATSSIRAWLSTHYASELEISLVLYARNIVDISEAIDHGMRDYITDYYTDAHKEALMDYYEYREQSIDSSRIEYMHVGNRPRGIPTNVSYRIEHYADVDLSFADMCEWWCEKKGIKKGQFYSDSNISRATFSYMKKHPEIVPKTYTAFACAIGLKLDIDQAKDLLMRAGLTFSKMFPFDQVVEHCIRSGMLDIDQINLLLFEKDLPLLGQKSEGGHSK